MQFYKSALAQTSYLLLAILFLVISLYSIFAFDETHNELQTNLLHELQRENAAAYTRAHELAQKHGNQALNLTSLYYEHRYKESAMDMLSRDLEASRAEDMVQLAALFIDGQPYMSDASKDIYSLMSSLLYQPYTSAGDQGNSSSLVSQFIKELNHMKAKGVLAWQTLCAHPFSLSVLAALSREEMLESEQLWSYYCENVAWLADALTLFNFFEIQNDTAAQHREESAHLIANYISLCKRYPAMATYTKGIVEQWNQTSNASSASEHSGALPDVECAITIPVIYSLFEDHGDILVRLHGDNAIPISECVDILLANNGVFVKSRAESTLDELIDSLAQLYKEDKEVWDIICMEPNALLLYCAHPEQAKDVLASYQAEGVADLIVRAATDTDGTVHTKALQHGVQAVSRYKALAIYVLAQYCGDQRMHHLLNMDFRSVLYLQMKGEEGFSHLQSDKARGYLDECLDRNGDPRSADWFEDLPFVGTQMKFANDLRRGYPVSISEAGWALLDTVEIVATAASFGSAAIVATGVKTGIKKTVKEVIHVNISRSLKGSTREQALSFLEQTRSLKNRSRFLHGRISSHVSDNVILTFSKIRIATSEATNQVIENNKGAVKSLISQKLNKYRHKIHATARVWLAIAMVAPQQSSPNKATIQSTVINATKLIESDSPGIGHIYSAMPQQKPHFSRYLLIFISLPLAIIFGLLFIYSRTHSITINL